MSRRSRVAALMVLVLISTAAEVLPATAKTIDATTGHRLIVAVEKNLPPSAEKKLSVLILVTQNGGPPAAALATASKPLTVHLDNRGAYRVKAEIDSACRGTCSASYRISGSANHKLEVVPSCHLNGATFACSKVKIVRVY